MMTLFVLVAITVAAGVLVVTPILQETRRPWTTVEPAGEAEALRQEELVALEALRDLAMDYKLGNLDATDYRALAAPLQRRARRVHALQTERVAQEVASLSISPDLDRVLEEEIRVVRRTLNGVANGGKGSSDACYCHQCGTAVQPRDRFCAACGTALRTVGNGVTKTNPDSESTAGETTQTVVLASAAVAPATTPAVVRSSEAVTNEIASDSRRRRLWWGAVVVVGIWIAVVAGIYLNGRNSQVAQTPIARFAGPVQTLTLTGGGLLLGTDKGGQLSADGRNWGATGLERGILAAVALDEMGTHWLASTSEGLWRSDGGDIWQPLETDLRFVGLASAPHMGLLWGVTVDELYQSEDGGATWTWLSSSLPGPAQTLALGLGVLFLGTDRGVFSSTDGGQTWTNRNGLVNGRIISLSIRSLAYDAINNLLYAGTPAGLSFLNLGVPGGWGQRSLEGDVTALAVDGENNQVLWVGTEDGRLFRSPDRGVSWR